MEETPNRGNRDDDGAHVDRLFARALAIETIREMAEHEKNQERQDYLYHRALRKQSAPDYEH